MSYKEKTCVICGKPFQPKTAGQKTCSAECSKLRHNEMSRKYHREHLSIEREQKRRWMEEQRHPERKKGDTIVAIGYAERQIEASLRKAGRVNTEL